MVMGPALRLKRKLPERHWKRLSSAGQWLVTVAIQPLVFAAKACPDVVLIRVKEKLCIVRTMDYRRHRVLLNVESITEYASRLHSCKKEPETVAWIETFFRAGDILFDVGANVGAYSLLAAKFHSGSVRIYAFEPAFPTFAQLCKNVLLNGCSEYITPLQVALSDRTEIGVFTYRSMTPGGSLHVLGQPAAHGGSAFEAEARQPVLSFRVDDLLQEFGIPPPNHIKIDVDGAELLVLKGADKTLSGPSVKSLILEVDQARREAASAVEYLLSKGFIIKSKHKYIYGTEGSLSTEVYNYIFHRPSACTCPNCSAPYSSPQA